jgi:ParB family chromosome partitioning protein
MEELAEEVRAAESLAAVVPVLQAHVPYDLTQKLHDWRPATEMLVEGATQARIDALLAEQEAITERLQVDYDEDDEGRPIDEALGRDWDRFEAIAEELPDLYATAEAKPVAVAPEKCARFTRFLVLQQDGTTKLSDRWYCAEKVDADGEPVTERAAPAAAASGMSEALAGELAMQRRDVLAVEIARDPYIALLYAQFAIVDRTVGRMRADYATYGTSLQANENDRWEPVTLAYDPERGTAHIRDSEAWRSLLWIESELDWDWCGGLDKLANAPRSKWAEGQLQRFDDFRALTEAARDALFAWAVAKSLKASGGVARLDAVHDRLAELLEIDVAKWWRPTKANYFGRITVDDIKSDLTEMSGGVASTAGKKGELAARAEELAAGASGHSDHVNGLGSRWVPAAMRFRALLAAPEAE